MYHNTTDPRLEHLHIRRQFIKTLAKQGRGADVESGQHGDSNSAPPSTLPSPPHTRRNSISEAAFAAALDGAVLGDHGDEDAHLLAPHDSLSPVQEAWIRGRWLLALLVLQSSSSFVLEYYEQLLREHLVVTLFLTMLATGSIKPTMPYFAKTLSQQAHVGLLLGAGLCAGGFLRVYLTNGDVFNSLAISTSLFIIVMTSVLAGAALPFGLARLGVDPANAGTSIQRMWSTSEDNLIAQGKSNEI